jgi:dihydroflavonol-4-reductase
MRTNVMGTRNVVAACRAAKVRRLVHFSSIHALDPHPSGDPVDERRPLYDRAEASPYQRSKARGEAEVLAGAAAGLDAVIVSPTGVFGPYDHGPSAQGRAMLQMARGKLPVVPSGGSDWVDVRDVVQGALAAEQRGRTGERYLLSGEWVALADLAVLFAAAADARGPWLVLPMWAARPLGWAGDAYTTLTRRPASVTRESLACLRQYREIRRAKAERDLGFSPRPIAETVADTVAWFRASGHLVPSQ